jgi:hypothetical protein
MATLPKVLISRADYQIGGGVALGLRTQEGFDPSRIDSLTKQINPPIVISVGIFATAKVPIKLRTVIDTGSQPSTEVWLRGKRWSDNTYLTVAADPPTLQYNWDFIILAIGSVIVAIVGVRSICKPSAAKALTLSSVSTTSTTLTGPSLAEEYLSIDVQRAFATSEQLFSRSTLLLVGGVVMAFVGVGVFFISPFFSGSPPASIHSMVDLLSSQQLLFAFRSFAVLFFIEAIAWFLLRQYRALIEDYKSFYRHYMRRANYLAAVKISTQKGDKQFFNRIVDTFLAEDLTGRLKKDETTENLEGQRLIDPNFAEVLIMRATELAQSAIALTGKSKKAE